MTPDQNRAMALWMQSAPPDRTVAILEGLAVGGTDPWLLLTPDEHTAALDALAERRRWVAAVSVAPSAVTEVSLSREMCYGTCPAYHVTLSTSGLVEYEGEAFVERIGQHHGEVDPDRVHDLVRVILRLGFTELEPEYPTEVTDQPSTELILTGEQQHHGVIDHGGAPLEFRAMAAVVDAIVDEVEWDEPDADGESAGEDRALDAD